MSSPWKKQPEVVAETVLKRAEIGKVNSAQPVLSDVAFLILSASSAVN